MYSIYHTKQNKQEKKDLNIVPDASMVGDEVKRECYIEDSRMTNQLRHDSSDIPNYDETVIKHESVDTDMKIDVWDEQEKDINDDLEDLSAYGDGSENQIYVKEEPQGDISDYDNGSLSSRNQDQINVQSDRVDLNRHVSNIRIIPHCH